MRKCEQKYERRSIYRYKRRHSFFVNISSDAHEKKLVWDQESECRESDGIVRRADSSFAPTASARAVTVLPVLFLGEQRLPVFRRSIYRNGSSTRFSEKLTQKLPTAATIDMEHLVLLCCRHFASLSLVLLRVDRCCIHARFSRTNGPIALLLVAKPDTPGHLRDTSQSVFKHGTLTEGMFNRLPVSLDSDDGARAETDLRHDPFPFP